ncbi:hypothetical protein V6N13_046379 [Hibiscus sabdariffa]
MRKEQITQWRRCWLRKVQIGLICSRRGGDLSIVCFLDGLSGFCLVEKEMDSEMMEIDCFFNNGDFEEIKLISMAILLVKEGANHTKIYKAWWFSEGSIGLTCKLSAGFWFAVEICFGIG